MLGYRHGFHAGNHADVIKHLVLQLVLAYMNRKEKPWWYIDTHAGAGCYDLRSAQARQNSEAETGIVRLWNWLDAPAAVRDFLDLVGRLNPQGRLVCYPGSPWIAKQFQRTDDHLRLYELHPADFAALRQLTRPWPRTSTQAMDGLLGLRANLPPPPRRGIVLIDPSYEVSQAYPSVADAVRAGLERFSSGVFLLWYPLLAPAPGCGMVNRLKRLLECAWLDVSLSIRSPRASPRGLYGSGMLVINPPWRLAHELDELLPALVQRLAGRDGEYRVEQRLD